MSNNQTQIPEFKKLGQRLIDKAIRYSSVHALNFFKDNFQNQGFTDTAFEAWQTRVNDTRVGGALLVQSGNLRDSLQILSRTNRQIIFGTHDPKAQIHNEGGVLTIPITLKSRRFFWFMYYKTGQEHWKWMAITDDESFKITMPQRKFIGHSETLMNELQQWWTTTIEKEFKQYINNL